MKKLSIISVVCALSLTGAMAAANAEVVVIGNSAAASLSQQDVQDIFLGKANTMPDGTPVEAVDLSEGNVTRDEFYQKALNRTASQIKSYWAKRVFTGKGVPLNTISSDGAAKAWVNAGEGRIAYIDAGSVDGSVKVLLRLQ